MSKQATPIPDGMVRLALGNWLIFLGGGLIAVSGLAMGRLRVARQQVQQLRSLIQGTEAVSATDLAWFGIIGVVSLWAMAYLLAGFGVLRRSRTAEWAAFVLMATPLALDLIARILVPAGSQHASGKPVWFGVVWLVMLAATVLLIRNENA
jgi:hypothetical protein